ncbi:MAG: hypothetical protein LBF28_00500 [Rickettsiales bacterium]|nr:hypothetical protein [Rickettsiales bacterium]
MNSFIIAALLLLPQYAAHADDSALIDTLFEQSYVNPTYGDYEKMADMVRICRRVTGAGTASDYVLQCLKRAKLIEIQERDNAARLFLVNMDAGGDSIINAISGDDRFIYINVLTNLRTCYRVVRETDDARDGYYAVEVCENN